MATRLKFDELNNLESTSKRRSMPYDVFFGEMELEDDEKERRILVAEKLEPIYLFILALMATQKNGEIDSDLIKKTVRERVIEIVVEVYGDSEGNITDSLADNEELKNLIDKATQEIIDSTKENRDDAYTFSEDRAIAITENETNRATNYYVLDEALENGFQYKEWVSKRDLRVRDTHILVDGTRIAIDAPFEVGESLMMFPLDNSMGASAEEIVNCRCALKFYRE